MKTKSVALFAFLTAVAAVMSSCEKKVTEPSKINGGGEKIAVRAYCSSEMKSSLKTAIADPATGSVVWSAGDDIKVFNDLGESSVLTLVSGAGTPNAVFEGEVFKGSGDTYYAVTPSAMQSSFEGGKITFSLPEEQGYVPGSYDSGACPFTATATLDGDKLDLGFSPAAGLVRFGLRGEGSVTGLTLTDKASDKAYTMTCTTPVALNGSTDTDFYFSVPGGSLKEGFSLEVGNNEGKVAIISTSKDNSVSNCSLKTFSEVSLDFQPIPDYVCFTALVDGSQISRYLYYGCTTDYSLNGFIWKPFNDVTVTLNKDEKIYFRGKVYDDGNYAPFSTPVGYFDLSGNIMFLYDKNKPTSKVINYEFPFHSAFYGCYIRNAFELKLPATTLSNGCYGYLFNGCSTLISAPDLSAAILAEDCYRSIFNGCTSLKDITIYADDISAIDCLSCWLLDTAVGTTGTLHNKGAAVYIPGDNIPENWVVVNE